MRLTQVNVKGDMILLDPHMYVKISQVTLLWNSESVISFPTLLLGKGTYVVITKHKYFVESRRRKFLKVFIIDYEISDPVRRSF